MEHKVHDILYVPVRVPALHELLGTPEGPLVQPSVGIYGKTSEKVGGDDHELVRETNLTRKLLKVGRSAGRLEHGEEASDAHGEVGGGGRYLKQ